MRQAQTKNHIPYRVTSFRNGDDLVFFPDSQEYFFFYSGMATPDRCVVEEHYEYPVTQLPYYKSPLPESGLLRQQFAGHRLLDNRDGGK